MGLSSITIYRLRCLIPETYHQCREALSTFLQVPPSPATDALYHQIHKGH
jgi:DNA-binding SARP family transcriptional activator